MASCWTVQILVVVLLCNLVFNDAVDVCEHDGCEKSLPTTHIPFVPFAKLPIKEPWKEGIDSGRSLNGAGNGIVDPSVINFGDIPTECPSLVQPTNIHFLVINLDRSKNRRRKMKSEFVSRGLPNFERVPGVIVSEENVDKMFPRRRHKSLKLADYGCALAHRAAWQRLVDGPHEWGIVLEDDAELMDGVNYTDMPLVPQDADLVLFRAQTILRWQPVCVETEVMRAYWGFGMVAYLLSKDGARRLLAATASGLSSPLDGKIWYTSSVYCTKSDYIYHPPCANPCPSSVRTWFNGELDSNTDYPD
eukprot:m.14996 g.14996  ORF g.14996 m.14996 type:complete len:305 (-) comp10382_c0_seq1:115-1029(-)